MLLDIEYLPVTSWVVACPILAVRLLLQAVKLRQHCHAMLLSVSPLAAPVHWIASLSPHFGHPSIEENHKARPVCMQEFETTLKTVVLASGQLARMDPPWSKSDSRLNVKQFSYTHLAIQFAMALQHIRTKRALLL